MIDVRKESDEVLYPAVDFVPISFSDLDDLEGLASLNERKRVRLCAHPSPDERIHEMFIVHAKECYVRPHRHLGKSESMVILKGRADVVLFDDNGDIINILEVGDSMSGKIMYYRMDRAIFHSLLIKSDYLVFYEVTEGPFRREATEFPDWAPAEGDSCLVEFRSKLESMAQAFKNPE